MDQDPTVSSNEYTRRYAELCSADPECDVFEFLRSLPAATSLERARVLLVDQRHRHRLGRPMPLRSYLDAFPDIAARGDLIRLLIDTERAERQGQRGRPKTHLTTTCAAPDPSLRARTLELPGPLSTRIDLEQESSQTDAIESTRLVEQVNRSTLGPAATEQTQGRLSFALDESYFLHSEEETLRSMLNSVRFTLVRRLGAGGMGVVYEAYDRERGELVALKTMRRADPAALVRFKQEFRSLCDITHPNLVTLYELFAVEDRWFFTMELVEGTSFIHFARGFDPNAPTVFVGGEDADGRGSLSGPGFDEQRLRQGLVQLGHGILALHHAGKLHRDIKPTNVLVTHEGRVVLLDFGLTVDLSESGRSARDERQIVGTVGTMAPEQAAGEATTPASDWYSVGVMLFEALTGRLPFQGSQEEVFAAKRNQVAPRADSITPGLPEDLVALCAQLLERDPRKRPPGREVIARASGGAVTADDDEESGFNTRPIPLIGRSRHKRVLGELFARIEHGRAERVYVFGPAGTGKTTLVQAFLKEAADAPNSIVLAGRCYERETVPYKALDSLIDALARFLRRLPASQTQELLPPDSGLLARLFPVLESVEGVREAAHSLAETPDRRELRRRGTRALRDLLIRIGARSKLVLAIDDLHWGDVDSALLLADVLAADPPPRLLFVGTARLDDSERGPFLRELDKAIAIASRARGCRELVVEPLTNAESRELALALIGHEDAVARAQAHMIARESRGNPLFIDELVKHVQSIDPRTRWDEVVALDLESVLWERVKKQPEDAQRLLKIVAISGRPIRQAIAFEAAGLGASSRVALVSLRNARLVRLLGAGPQDEIEIYHDRIRETTAAHMSASELAETHGRLAVSLEAAGAVDAEVLTQHFRMAGDSRRASRYALIAADHSARALAFDHAADLYALALALLDPRDPAALRTIGRKLADALASAGQAQAAAAAYQRAALAADPAETLELERLAAIQLFLSGRLSDGLAVLRTLLERVGEGMPRTQRSALLWLAAHRLRLRLRGIGFKERTESELTQTQLARIDLCWAAVKGLSMNDPLRGAEFQARGLRHALNAGEPFRIARALALEASHRASNGSADPRIGTLIQAANTIAQRLNSPYLHGMVAFAQGAEAMFQDRWKDAVNALDLAEHTLRDQCAGVAWERDTVHNFTLWSLLQMGEIGELKTRWHALYRESQERGDIHAVLTLSLLYMTLITLAENRPIDFESRLEATFRDRKAGEFGLQHGAAFDSLLHIDLYRGDVVEAYKRVMAVWPLYERASLFRVRILRVLMHEQRGRAALAAADRAIQPGPYLKIALEDATALAREHQPSSLAHAAYLRAGLAAGREDVAATITHLNEAERRYREAGMSLRALLIRMRLGEVDVSTPRPTRDVIEQAISNQGIVSPARWASLFAPGFTRVSGDSMETSV